MSEGLRELRELRRGVLAVPDPETDAERRARIVSRMTVLQGELVRGDQLRRRTLGTLLAAACLILVLMSLPDRHEQRIALVPETVHLNVIGGRVSMRDGGSLATLDQGQVELPRDALIRADSAALLRLESNAALSLSASSQVQLSSRLSRAGGRQERVRLVGGRVDLDVPKLGPGATLEVETQDAVVEVRGTRFAVSLVERAAMPPFTRVDVSEGRVSVRLGSEVRELSAGQSWSALSEKPAPPVAASPIQTDAERPAPAQPPELRTRAPALPKHEVSRSDLAEQNRLLEAAELARESKLFPLALERFERLITRYPESELAHNARVARLRLLADMGRAADARAAATDYLARHPGGFASSEARRMLERTNSRSP